MSESKIIDSAIHLIAIIDEWRRTKELLNEDDKRHIIDSYISAVKDLSDNLTEYTEKMVRVNGVWILKDGFDHVIAKGSKRAMITDELLQEYAKKL